MNKLLKLEEALMFAFSIYLFTQLDFAWWWFPALLLAPDIGMIGYLHGPRLGSITYNITHHKGIALAVLLVGYYNQHDWTTLAGIILFGHSSMDRILGYGLKYPDSFQHTHLGKLKPAGQPK